jgi:hypothetical protein
MDTRIYVLVVVLLVPIRDSDLLFSVYKNNILA